MGSFPVLFHSMQLIRPPFTHQTRRPLQRRSGDCCLIDVSIKRVMPSTRPSCPTFSLPLFLKSYLSLLGEHGGKYERGRMVDVVDAPPDTNKGLVPIAEAAAIACFEVGMTGPYLPRNIDIMADTVAQLCSIYLGSSADKTITALKKDELVGGRFVDGARRMVFQDQRPALEHLFVTRTALRAALATIAHARTVGSG